MEPIFFLIHVLSDCVLFFSAAVSSVNQSIEKIAKGYTNEELQAFHEMVRWIGKGRAQISTEDAGKKPRDEAGMEEKGKTSSRRLGCCLDGTTTRPGIRGIVNALVFVRNTAAICLMRVAILGSPGAKAARRRYEARPIAPPPRRPQQRRKESHD